MSLFLLVADLGWHHWIDLRNLNGFACSLRPLRGGKGHFSSGPNETELTSMVIRRRNSSRMQFISIYRFCILRTGLVVFNGVTVVSPDTHFACAHMFRNWDTSQKKNNVRTCELLQYLVWLIVHCCQFWNWNRENFKVDDLLFAKTTQTQDLQHTKLSGKPSL